VLSTELLIPFNTMEASLIVHTDVGIPDFMNKELNIYD